MLHNMPDNERYCQRLYRRLKMNPSHVRTMVQRLEGLRLIQRVPEQKIRYIRLTESGSDLAELAMRMKSVLKEAGIHE